MCKSPPYLTRRIFCKLYPAGHETSIPASLQVAVVLPPISFLHKLFFIFIYFFFTQRSILERAIEEQPTEIFVRHEIPFDLELVGTLLEEIRGSLVGGSTPTQQKSLPELRVTKMDDITSCLAVLRDYVASVSCNFAGKRDAFQLELKHSREQITDLELQLQETIRESESSEGGLLTKLQVSC